MNVTFQISTGHVWIDDVLQKETAYSGHGDGLNQPKAEDRVGVGPLPEGLYLIGNWQDRHPHLGLIVARLFPKDVPKSYHRSGFFIHGDNQKRNHSASDGCVIMDRPLRLRVRDSGAKLLKVIA